jgi:hypothetical protein
MSSPPTLVLIDSSINNHSLKSAASTVAFHFVRDDPLSFGMKYNGCGVCDLAPPTIVTLARSAIAVRHANVLGLIAS